MSDTYKPWNHETTQEEATQAVAMLREALGILAGGCSKFEIEMKTPVNTERPKERLQMWRITAERLGVVKTEES